jgi:uncharacterized protein
VSEVNEPQRSESPVPAAEKQKRGLALLSVERRREIASAGGKTAHRIGRAHEFSSEEGRRAGRKGGLSVSRDRDYMRSLGKKGGQAKAHNRSPKTAASYLQVSSVPSALTLQPAGQRVICGVPAPSLR